MNGIWSENKYVNTIVNILLYLVAINIFHYGQLLLPIICLILFADNKFKFKVNDIKIFILLCLFAISFFGFGYKLGFYRTMGFCLPMAYYIGSGIKERNENNYKKIIYLITFGMISHVLLNFAYDLSLFGLETFAKRTHYDIWLQAPIAVTTTASNGIFLIGCIFYLLFKEKNKLIKYVLLICFVLFMVYNLGLGRRTPVFMIIVSLLTSIATLVCISVKREKIIRKVLLCVATIVLLGILAIVLFKFNIFNFAEFVNSLNIYNKFFEYGLDFGRLDIVTDAIKLMPYHLFGNKEISNILGISIHDLWLDTYDLGGIIPFVSIVVYSLYVAFRILRKIVNKEFTEDFVIFIIPFFVCISLEMIIEPIMSSLTIYIICSIMIFTVVENI